MDDSGFEDSDPTWDWDEKTQQYVKSGTVGELNAHIRSVVERSERATTYQEKYDIWAEEGIYDGALLALARKETTTKEGST